MTNNKGAFEVEVHPNVDYAFIAALLTIVDQINNSKFDTKIIKAEIAGAIVGVAATTAQVMNDDDDDENNDDKNNDDHEK